MSHTPASLFLSWSSSTYVIVRLVQMCSYVGLFFLFLHCCKERGLSPCPIISLSSEDTGPRFFFFPRWLFMTSIAEAAGTLVNELFLSGLNWVINIPNKKNKTLLPEETQDVAGSRQTSKTTKFNRSVSWKCLWAKRCNTFWMRPSSRLQGARHCSRSRTCTSARGWFCPSVSFLPGTPRRKNLPG